MNPRTTCPKAISISWRMKMMPWKWSGISWQERSWISRVQVVPRRSERCAAMPRWIAGMSCAERAGAHIGALGAIATELAEQWSAAIGAQGDEVYPPAFIVDELAPLVGERQRS